MKNLTRIFIASAITTFLIVLIAAGAVWQYTRIAQEHAVVVTEPSPTPLPMVVMPTLVPTVDPARLQALEIALQNRNLTYEEQISTLESLRAEREAAYQAEISNAQSQVVAYQNALAQAEQAQANLQQQINDLQTALTERQSLYPDQLQQAQTQADSQFQALQNELAQAQQTLAQVQSQLGQ